MLAGVANDDPVSAFLFLVIKGRCQTPIIVAEHVEAPAHGRHLLVEVPSPNAVPRRN